MHKTQLIKRQPLKTISGVVKKVKFLKKAMGPKIRGVAREVHFVLNPNKDNDD